MVWLDTFLYIFLGFLGVILIVIVGFFIYITGQYKHVFVRKDLTGEKPFKVIDKAREIYEKKTGVYYWKLLKAKHRIARPPNTAINPTEKGNYFVEAYYLGDVNYIYSKDELSDDTREEISKYLDDFKITYQKGFLSKLKAKLQHLQQLKLFRLTLFKPSPIYIYTHDYKDLKELKGKNKLNKTINSYKPITTNQRLIAYQQIKKAYEKKITGLAQYLPIIVSVVGIIVLVSLVLIFGGELITPIANLGGQLANNQEAQITITNTQAHITNMLSQIIQERQVISGEVSKIPLLNQTPPS